MLCKGMPINVLKGRTTYCDLLEESQIASNPSSLFVHLQRKCDTSLQPITRN